MKTKASLVIDVLLLILLTAFLINGSRPARHAEQTSANNNRLLRILIADCQARGGCAEVNR